MQFWENSLKEGEKHHLKVKDGMEMFCLLHLLFNFFFHFIMKLD